MKQLIGITGFKRTGKDTLTRLLCERLSLEQYSFADPIRNMVCEMLGITRAQLEEVKEAPIDWLNGVTPRHLMQSVGTEWGRHMIHPELWIRAMLHRMPAIGGVTSDVRFDNEARILLEHGATIIRVHRPGCGSDGHVSEQGISDELVTVDLLNDGTPEQLLEKALACLDLG